MRKLLPISIALVIFAVYAFTHSPNQYSPRHARQATPEPQAAPTRRTPAIPKVQLADGTQVQGQGAITKILSDDNDGSRHQRFILQLSTGQTLLIAHNIDIAPRLNGINVGDVVEFYGEYAWNEQGGVIHWTHHDPGGRHVAGWLRHGGQVVQ